MLTSLIIQLTAPAGAVLPAALGRAAQALLLDVIHQNDPALAQSIHSGDGPRPYTVSNLVMGRRKAGSVYLQAGQEGWLRFTGLTGPVSRQLQALAARPPQVVALDSQEFLVTGAALDPAEHAWAGQTSYQDLAAPYLLGGKERLSHKVELLFTSPTTFKRSGRYVPLPAPELVFGSLLDRWQHFAPIALHPDMRRFAAETVALRRYRLRTRGAPQKQGGMRIGFTGRATFTALNRDRYWLNMLHLLAAYAFYCGVGAGTGAGLGQVRGF